MSSWSPLSSSDDNENQENDEDVLVVQNRFPQNQGVQQQNDDANTHRIEEIHGSNHQEVSQEQQHQQHNSQIAVTNSSTSYSYACSSTTDSATFSETDIMPTPIRYDWRNVQVVESIQEFSNDILSFSDEYLSSFKNSTSNRSSLPPWCYKDDNKKLPGGVTNYKNIASTNEQNRAQFFPTFQYPAAAMKNPVPSSYNNTDNSSNDSGDSSFDKHISAIPNLSVASTYIEQGHDEQDTNNSLMFLAGENKESHKGDTSKDKGKKKKIMPESDSSSDGNGDSFDQNIAAVLGDMITAKEQPIIITSKDKHPSPHLSNIYEKESKEGPTLVTRPGYLIEDAYSSHYKKQQGSSGSCVGKQNENYDDLHLNSTEFKGRNNPLFLPTLDNYTYISNANNDHNNSIKETKNQNDSRTTRKSGKQGTTISQKHNHNDLLLQSGIDFLDNQNETRKAGLLAKWSSTKIKTAPRVESLKQADSQKVKTVASSFKEKSNSTSSTRIKEKDDPVTRKTGPSNHFTALSGNNETIGIVHDTQTTPNTEDTAGKSKNVASQPTHKTPTNRATRSSTSSTTNITTASDSILKEKETATKKTNNTSETAIQKQKVTIFPYQNKQWMEKYQDLLDFKQQHGHCHVPFRYGSNKTSKGGSELGQWVKRQRHQYKRLQAGKRSHLTPERIQMLEDIGFKWDTHAAAWEENFEGLKKFQEENNHCIVPNSNVSLSAWVKRQRRQYKFYVLGRSSTMTAEREERLLDLGLILNNPEETEQQGNDSDMDNDDDGDSDDEDDV